MKISHLLSENERKVLFSRSGQYKLCLTWNKIYNITVLNLKYQGSIKISSFPVFLAGF